MNWSIVLICAIFGLTIGFALGVPAGLMKGWESSRPRRWRRAALASLAFTLVATFIFTVIGVGLAAIDAIAG